MKINFINILKNFNKFYIKFILKKQLPFLIFKSEIFSKLDYLIINSNNKMLLKLSYLEKIKDIDKEICYKVII